MRTPGADGNAVESFDDTEFMIPSEQVAAAPPVQVPAMRPGPRRETAVRAAPVPPSRRGLPVALTAGTLCGVLGLLVAPVLLGPAALAGGFAGEHLGRHGTRKAGAAAALVAVAGALATVLALR